MKKFVSALLVSCIMVQMIIPSLALTSANTQVAHLQELGFPQEFLDSITDADINCLYEKSQVNTLCYKGKTTAFLYTDDHSDAVSPYGTIPREDMILNIYSVSVADDSCYTEFMMFVTYEWTTGRPNIRRGDGVAVNWDESLFYVDAKTFKCRDNAYFQNKLLSSNSSSVASALAQGGLGYNVNFPVVGQGEDELQLKYTFSGSASFSLFPKRTMYSGNNEVTTVAVEYCHNKTAIIGSVGFIYKGFSVSISTPVLSDSVADNCLIRYGESMHV